ncbi:hypothetical protein EMIHUDRAFT_462777 [Emiliania huxleyi CCMP1516]|uniref:RecF/RecN/SMC N-terminal domain-containing protein n=2 Tax=Emiliania huxleyi TaxID=2903 RepID=A0A0D3K924_EMIH1|nr:hypothetical protein EMIHUDRAFT_462777 [Emiliania huxleyi CCMP1516]EOD32259.1 hypothetical protein EMIHUDRAFT_462777 [Emiliania huxleyi CCMP1516]|eukprot:XP_005784688.1 hypothetical protein EMIHUDRAFT_462777 [Emiliania huxleyi CCMP1516]
MPAARTSAGRPGRPIQAENGVLRSITLTNFKAHSHFHLDFNPHVNFIVGSNGTGKSAILAGVIQALGGNPNKHSGTAGGARAAQGLIQDGKDYASVVLVLYNGSDDPWETQRASTQTQARLEEERNVTVTSELTRLAGNKTSSRYKINGVAATRKQVAALAEHFNLQVENPCAVLTQAVHANFLRETSGGKRRYDFFLAACNADIVRERLLAARDEYKGIATSLEKHEERGAPLADRVGEATRREESAVEELGRLRALTEERTREREVRLQQLHAAQAAAKAAAQEHRKAQRAAGEAQDALGETRGELAAARRRRDEVSAQHERKRGNLDSAKAAAAARLDAARRSAGDAKAAAAAEVAEVEAAREAAARQARASKERADGTSKRAEALRREAAAARDDLSRARSAQGDHLKRIDPAMPKLLAELGRARWPSGHPPVGPIGAHTHAPKLCSVRILVQQREARFKPAPSRHPDVASVLDAVEAFNALLNFYSPEALLIGGLTDARELFKKRVPFVAFDADGMKHYLRGELEASEQTGSHTARGLMRMDSAAVLSGLEQRQAAAEAEAAQAAEEARGAAAEAARGREEEEALGRRWRQAAERARAAERQMAGVEQAGLRDDVEEDLRLLQEDLSEIESDIGRLAQEEMEREGAARLASEAVPPLQRSQKLAEAEVRSLGGRGAAEGDGGLDEELKRANGAVHKARQAAERQARALREQELEVERAKEEAEGIRARVASQFAEPEAAGGGAGSSGGESVEAVQKRLQKMRAALKKAEHLAGGENRGETTYAALLQAQRDAERAMAEHEEQITAVKATAKVVEDSVQERYKFHRRFLKAQGVQAVSDFQMHLSRRSMGGSLRFDHKEDVLEAQVAPRAGDAAARSTTALRSLSGGEQAFSTLSLVLAMWQLSATPMRALDEFDKNMDSSFQAASLKLLFEIFRQQPGRQFLILTPLDYSSLFREAGVDERDAVIHRMPDVVRH